MTIEEADVNASTALLFRYRTSLNSVNTEPVKVRNSEEEQSLKKLSEILPCPEQSARSDVIPAKALRQLLEVGFATHATRPSVKVKSAIEAFTQPMQLLSLIFTVLDSFVTKYPSAESAVCPSYKAYEIAFSRFEPDIITSHSAELHVVV